MYTSLLLKVLIRALFAPSPGNLIAKRDRWCWQVQVLTRQPAFGCKKQTKTLNRSRLWRGTKTRLSASHGAQMVTMWRLVPVTRVSGSSKRMKERCASMHAWGCYRATPRTSSLSSGTRTGTSSSRPATMTRSRLGPTRTPWTNGSAITPLGGTRRQCGPSTSTQVELTWRVAARIRPGLSGQSRRPATRSSATLRTPISEQSTPLVGPRSIVRTEVWPRSTGLLL